MHGLRVLSVAKAPPDDQHTVYRTGAWPVVGSGSAAPPNQLLIRTPDNSLKKLKKSKIAASHLVDDFLDDCLGMEDSLNRLDEASDCEDKSLVIIEI